MPILMGDEGGVGFTTWKLHEAPLGLCKALLKDSQSTPGFWNHEAPYM